MRVALTGLTTAEYFRDEEGQDVLLFVDNIFRFTQAGSEVSALLGRMPSAVGYQPTLATEMGELQERVVGDRHHCVEIVGLVRREPAQRPAVDRAAAHPGSSSRTLRIGSLGSVRVIFR